MSIMNPGVRQSDNADGVFNISDPELVAQQEAQARQAARQQTNMSLAQMTPDQQINYQLRDGFGQLGDYLGSRAGPAADSPAVTRARAIKEVLGAVGSIADPEERLMELAKGFQDRGLTDDANKALKSLAEMRTNRAAVAETNAKTKKVTAEEAKIVVETAMAGSKDRAEILEKLSKEFDPLEVAAFAKTLDLKNNEGGDYKLLKTRKDAATFEQVYDAQTGTWANVQKTGLKLGQITKIASKSDGTNVTQNVDARQIPNAAKEVRENAEFIAKLTKPYQDTIDTGNQLQAAISMLADTNVPAVQKTAIAASLPAMYKTMIANIDSGGKTSAEERRTVIASGAIPDRVLTSIAKNFGGTIRREDLLAFAAAVSSVQGVAQSASRRIEQAASGALQSTGSSGAVTQGLAIPNAGRDTGPRIDPKSTATTDTTFPQIQDPDGLAGTKNRRAAENKRQNEGKPVARYTFND